MPHIRGPRSAFVSFKCPKKEIQFARRWSALAMPHGHALIKKKEKAQKKKEKNRKRRAKTTQAQKTGQLATAAAGHPNTNPKLAAMAMGTCRK